MILQEVMVFFDESIDQTCAAIALMCVEFKIELYYEGKNIFVGSIDENNVHDLCRIDGIKDIADENDRPLCCFRKLEEDI